MSAGGRTGRWRVGTRGVWRVLLILALGSLVATVVAAPVVLGGGLALQALANRSRALPSEVTAVRLPQRSVLTDVTGRMLVELHGPEDRVVVPLQAIAPVMQHAIVAVEDATEQDRTGYRGRRSRPARASAAVRAEDGGAGRTTVASIAAGTPPALSSESSGI